MSRPHTPSMPTFQPQGPAPMDPNAGRLMQVKVLYTFDDAKTNCLARCPHPVSVRTAMLDLTTEVGIIELRTCIQAIVQASPELVAKLGQDFTIYAYDYSEYETPLVGQGMLSWALASTSATPTAPAQQSQTPVTGRVTRGGLNLFHGGASETLEVKLKLVPVPTSLQSDYLESMQKYRDASNFTSQGGDTAAWNDFVRANPSFAAPDPNLGQQPQNPQPSATPQHVFQPQPLYDAPQHSPALALQPNQFHPANAPSSRPASRPSTPKGRRAGQQSRQSSRASSTRDRPKPKKAASTTLIETSDIDESGEFGSEQPRKRARVEQTSWRGPSALSASNDSLRVAASTAASIRGHAPPAANPVPAHIAATEPPVRPPTPRPAPPRQLKRTNTSVAHDAMMHRPRQTSRLATGSLTDNEGSVADSPESQYDSAGSSPMDIPSSPPLMGQISIAPSSPALPRSADFIDSGFGSCGLDDFFDEKANEDALAADDDDELHALPPSGRTNQRAIAPTSELSITEEVPGDPSLLPQRVFLTTKPNQHAAPKPTRKRRVESVAPSSPKLQPQTSYSSNEAALPAPDTGSREADYAPAAPTNEDLSAAQIPGLPSIAPRPPNERRDSSASLPPPAVETRRSKQVTKQEALDAGSGVKRRQAIKGRLEADLAAGKLPQFCNNCGEIETPTWRKCYVRKMQGAPPDFNPHVGEESYLANEVTERNEAGQATAYRILRRNIAKGEMGWDEWKLCNSCGMWLFKLKSMRPPEKWGRSSKPKNASKKKAALAKTGDGTKDPQSDAGSPADDEAETPYEPEVPQADEEPFRAGDANSDYDARNGSGPRERSAGAELEPSHVGEEQRLLDDASALAALERAIKSSPPKFPGSEAAPIDADVNGDDASVRRLLFPSPRKSGQMKTLDGSGVEQGDSVTITVTAASGLDGTAEKDKENSLRSPARRASTPTVQPIDLESVFKTPARRTKSATGLTPDNFSSNGTQLRRSPRNKSKSPNKNPVTPFTATMNQMMSDPPQSPTDFSDQFNMFSDAAFADANNNFNFNDFTNDGYVTDMPIPQSDADYFPVLNDFDMSTETWDGGPLFDGELDALLREAGDKSCETYFAAAGDGATPASVAGTASGMTPAQQEGMDGA